MNLVVHCGGRQVDRAVVERCPTPARTATWVPIPHGCLLNEIEVTLVRAGLRVVSQAHALSRDGLRYFGLLELGNGHAQDDYALVVGLRNSHDKMFPASLAVGSGVFVCDNLAFSGEITIARRHTVMIEADLPRLLSTAVGRLGEARQRQDQRLACYKERRLSEAQAHDLMIRAVDAQVLPITTLPQVIDEWREPRHVEFSAGPRTAWRFLNAVTEAIKGRSLEALPRRTQALHGLLDVACGLETSN